MVIEKRISEWENILVDTSILCALFKAAEQNSVDEQFLFVKKLIDYLSKTKTGNLKDRRFFITSITVSELLSKENEQEKIEKIVRILDSHNVEFLDFDLGSAFLLNHDFHEILNRRKLNNFAAEMGFKSGDFMMAREWISKDMMIIQNGKYANVDVILTCDKNTFYPISKKSSVFTALAYEEYFKHEYGVMLAYLHDLAKLNYIASL
ncbi:hypothetical protein [uncultured Chryseobacterium sp.]|uniref:type II toxin-antitoxin system VapC family toxin n=1 Tax=uncultured Chryseobacterium sp. TaxID=259322 RepID=UPI0025DCD0C2|nr:hypothetical protein [uncultured Chryseobacterium sp.]